MPASFLASLPRTWATVSAGTIGASLLEGQGEGGMHMGVGLACALAATVLVARVAKDALDEMQAEETAAAEQPGKPSR
jgi:hypothetical protein